VTNVNSLIQSILADSLRIQAEFLRDNADKIEDTAHQLASVLRDGHKILLFGNGGSAAQAQHIAAEFVGRFAKERRVLPAIALTADTAILTAIANDYGYESVFLRQVQALRLPGDALIGISTSGNSLNVNRALWYGKDWDCRTIGFTGESGGVMAKENCVDSIFKVPSTTTARIQEMHLLLGHILCELVERELFPE